MRIREARAIISKARNRFGLTIERLEGMQELEQELICKALEFEPKEFETAKQKYLSSYRYIGGDYLTRHKVLTMLENEMTCFMSQEIAGATSIIVLKAISTKEIQEHYVASYIFNGVKNYVTKETIKEFLLENSCLENSIKCFNLTI